MGRRVRLRRRDLAFIGLIHGERVEWNANGQVSLGYLFAGLILLAFVFLKPKPSDETPDAAGEPERTPARPVSAEAPATS